MKAYDEEHELLDKVESRRHHHVDTRRFPSSLHTSTRTTPTCPGKPDAAANRLPPPIRRNPFSAWLVWLVFTILLCLFAASLFGFQHKDELRRIISSQDSEQLAIKLHPSKHSTREPTTLSFQWNITLGTRAPDGVEKLVYLVNGQFPGPTIEARSGDRILVNVHNGLPDGEGVSIHWHGLRMKGHNAMDGAVGFTQCPIPSGSDFTYDFQIGNEEHGTFWWHSHSELQLGDGLFGGLVVHQHRRDRDHVPHDEVLLLVGDWFHRPQAEVAAQYWHAKGLALEPVPDSILVNGRGRYNCSMAVPARPVECKKVPLTKMRPLFRKRSSRTRLRVVNTGTIAGLRLQLDGATLRPIEVDGGCMVDAPSTESVGILYPGERVDLEVSWRESYTKNPWLNVFLDPENFKHQNPALAPNHSFPVIPKTLRGAERKAPLIELEKYQDLTTLPATATVKPVYHNSTQETILLYLKTEVLAIEGNKPMGFINRTSWLPSAMPLISEPRSTWDSHQFVPLIESDTDFRPKQVTLVLNNLDDGSHPFHMHGYSFEVLSSYQSDYRGHGSYNPFAPPRENDIQAPGRVWNKSPLRKDTVSVPRRGSVVLSFTADNPGTWMLHCHMLVHMGTGMAAGIQVGNVSTGAVARSGPTFDPSAARLCPSAMAGK